MQPVTPVTARVSTENWQAVILKPLEKGYSIRRKCTDDGYVKSPDAALRGILRRCGVRGSTPHSSGRVLARLACGLFTKPSLFETFQIICGGSVQMKKLKLGIPKGSLEANTVELFKRAGWRITYDSRSYFPDIDDEEISCTLVRAQEMSRYVEDGTLDLGLTGQAWIIENESGVLFIQDLVYSKTSARQAKWVLVVREDSPIRSLADMEGKKVSAGLGNFTMRYFAERNINVQVEFS